MLLYLGIFLCVVTGFLVASIAIPLRDRRSGVFLLKAALAAPLGIGVFSITYSAWRAGSSSRTLLVIADFAVLGMLLVVAGIADFVHVSPTAQDEPRISVLAGTKSSLALSWIFWLALVNSVLSCVRGAWANPMGGGWDAVAIWNLRARFLFLGGQHWRDGFSKLIPWSHPDYPLLLPAGIAHFWTYVWKDSERVPAIVGIVFAFSTIALLFAGVHLRRGRVQAQLAALVLMGTPFFLKQAVSEYADIPLAFFFLATFSLLALRDRVAWSESAGLALAGFTAGLAAWTKNEGLLFLCVFLLVFGSVAWRAHRRVAVRQMAWIVLGAAPAIVVLACFKVAIATPGDLFSAQGLWLKLVDPARYWLIFRWYLKEFFLFGEWAVIPVTIILVIYAKVVGTTASPKDTSVAASTLALTLMGYAAIYVITPYDLHWHLRFSLNRLFLQVWPSALFIFFSVVRTPEEALTTRTVVPEDQLTVRADSCATYNSLVGYTTADSKSRA